MSDTIDTIEVRANVIMTTASLKAIVENTKKFADPDEKGHYKVDTADAVSRLISRFLLERDFETFARDEGNYPALGHS
ncbi:MAG: hypothetical protein WAK95_13885 [Desulfobacterales bacterium]